MRRAAELLARAAWVLRRVIGAPDYAAYVTHLRSAHPEMEPLTREAFAHDVLARKYELPGSRCC